MRPAARAAHVVTGGGGTVGNALVDHPDVALITFTGSPEVGWGIRARAPRKRVGLELGNNAPVIIEPDGDWKTAADKIKVAGFSHAGQSLHLDPAGLRPPRRSPTTSPTALAERVAALVVGDPLDERTDVSALISAGERDRVAAWIDEAVAGGRQGRRRRRRRRRRRARADGAHRRHARHEGVRQGGVRPGGRDPGLRRRSTTRSPSPTTPSYGLQAAIFTADLAHGAARPSRTLDFGGVLVNEVPTWRADQMPYGGVRDSGNTREGPALRRPGDDRAPVSSSRVSSTVEAHDVTGAIR